MHSPLAFRTLLPFHPREARRSIHNPDPLSFTPWHQPCVFSCLLLTLSAQASRSRLRACRIFHAALAYRFLSSCTSLSFLLKTSVLSHIHSGNMRFRTSADICSFFLRQNSITSERRTIHLSDSALAQFKVHPQHRIRQHQCARQYHHQKCSNSPSLPALRGYIS